jgi:hypothetical protein
MVHFPPNGQVPSTPTQNKIRYSTVFGQRSCVISKEKTSVERKNSIYSTKTQPKAETKERSAPARVSENSAELNSTQPLKKEKGAKKKTLEKKNSRTFLNQIAAWSSKTGLKKVKNSKITLLKYIIITLPITGHLNQDQVAQVQDDATMNQDDFLNFQIDAFRRKKEEKAMNQDEFLNLQIESFRHDKEEKIMNQDEFLNLQQHATAQDQNTRHQRRSSCHCIPLLGESWSSRPPITPGASQEVPREQARHGQGQHDARPEHAQYVGQGPGRQQLQQVITQHINIKSSNTWQKRKLDILNTRHLYALQRV